MQVVKRITLKKILPNDEFICKKTGLNTDDPHGSIPWHSHAFPRTFCTKFGQAWKRTAERWGIEFEMLLMLRFPLCTHPVIAFWIAPSAWQVPYAARPILYRRTENQIAFDAAIKPLLDAGDVIVHGLVFARMSPLSALDMRGFPRYARRRFSLQLPAAPQMDGWDVFAVHKYFGIKPNPLYMQVRLVLAA